MWHPRIDSCTTSIAPDMSRTCTPILAPSIGRRLASMLYEAMLLFGVLFMSNWLFSVLTDQRHALDSRHALQVWLFLVMTLYFAWFWSHGGQTLAMKAWRIRLVTVSGAPVGVVRAFARYLLAWAWVLPGMALAWGSGAQGPLLLLIPAANLMLWAALAWLDPERQFLHDRIAGTRLALVNRSMHHADPA
jgi:uncharacterized RDD family membrane protein YckC